MVHWREEGREGEREREREGGLAARWPVGRVGVGIVRGRGKERGRAGGEVASVEGRRGYSERERERKGEGWWQGGQW